MKNMKFTTNTITAVLLIGIAAPKASAQIHSKSVEANLDSQIVQKPYSYLDNPAYQEITDFYTVYSGQKNIVMLGNSLTYRISWPELMGREDIANRGIGSDITEGFINRLNFVLNVKPRICFIEGGVNDLARNINNETIIKNLNTILDTLQNNKIIPVLTTLTYVTPAYKNAAHFNLKIKALNELIIELSEDRKIRWIDLNKLLADGDFLRMDYAIKDGIHYTAKGYKIWRDEMVKILEQEKI